METSYKPAILAVLATVVLGAPAALGQTVSADIAALQPWDDAARATAPRWVQIWLTVLVGIFAAGLLFVWWRVEARWAVGGFLAMVATGATLSQAGFPVLVGLAALLHLIFWSPALYLLLTRRPFLKERSLYALWSAALTGAILFSFVFDIRDAAIYLDHITGISLLS